MRRLGRIPFAPAASSFLLGALLAAVALAPGTALAAGGEAARPADSFVDSIGVNTHSYYDGTPYYDEFATVEQRLRELGVRHLREGLALGRDDQYRMLGSLAAHGIRSTLILGEPEIGESGLAQMIATLKGPLAGAVEAVEGPNEYDTWGGSDWAAKLVPYQQRLYDAVKSDPALASLPVIGPSIVWKRSQQALGDISRALDYGNVHPYPQGDIPEANVDSYLARAALNSGSKPVMATETGYHNAMGWTGEQAPVAERAAAVYMPRLFLDYFARGYARTFAYELVDLGTDPSDREANWGLLRHDLSVKPAFVALQNTIAILADPGPEFAAESVDYSLGGNLDGLHRVLLQKRDGSFYLALWRAQPVDPASGDPTVSPGLVSLDFNRRIAGVERYLPDSSAAPVSRPAPRGGRVAVTVGPEVTILRLRLAAPAAASTRRIRLWVSRRSVPAGGRVAVRGKLPHRAAGRVRGVRIQRWTGQRRGWRTVGRGRATANGRFKKAMRINRSFGRVSRLRVVAGPARPSRPVTLRVHDRNGAGAIGEARALSNHPG